MADPSQNLDNANVSNSDKKSGKNASASSSLTVRVLMEQDAPVKPATEAAAPAGILTKPAEAAAGVPLQPKETAANPFQIYNSSYHPVQTALTARIAYHGLKGNLLLDKTSAVAKLAATGPLGEQLAQRVGVMEAQGWSIGRMTTNDPYLSQAFKNPVKRMLMFPQIAGYNTLYHEDVLMKRITYNSWSHLANQALTSFGEASPASRVVGNLAHELGHWDRVPLPEVSQLKNMSAADQRIFAMRLLQTETNAILPQLHVSQKMGVFHADLEIYREALKTNQLGSVLRNRWLGYGNIYKTFEQISPKEADAFVKELLETNYKGVVKPNGSIAAYDLNAIRGKYFGHTAYDEAILAKIDTTARGVQTSENSMLKALAESRAGAPLRRGGQAVAGLAVGLIGTEIAAGFYESTEKGLGKVGRTAVTWGAYEVGSAGGALLGAPLARLAMKTKYGYMALPVATILGGITTSSTVDMLYGNRIEGSIQNAFTSKPEDELRRTLLGK
jgi:hypothetical protein